MNDKSPRAEQRPDHDDPKEDNAHPLDEGVARYQANVDRVNSRFPERRGEFTTGSQDPIERLYTPRDQAQSPHRAR